MNENARGPEKPQNQEADQGLTDRGSQEAEGGAVLKRPRAYLVTDARSDAHAPPGYHPERPERLAAAVRGAEQAGIEFTRIVARDATSDELVRVHTAEYIERLHAWAPAASQAERGLAERGLAPQVAPTFLDPDTYLAPGSVDAALKAAGGTTALVEAILDARPESAGGIRKGVALVRPPGHHARPGQAMGFCLLNNVAVAAACAKARGISKIAIVDFDVHHGNGTQEMFWRDPGVLYISTHQGPFYPGTGLVSEVGAGDGQGFTVNIPLAAGADESVYRAAFERLLLPIVDEYAPQLILVSAGFDASIRDPLSEMRVRPEAYGFMTAELRKLADQHAQGRIALVLEGGYDLPSLELATEHACRALFSVPQAIAGAVDTADIEQATRGNAPYWKSIR